MPSIHKPRQWDSLQWVTPNLEIFVKTPIFLKTTQNLHSGRDKKSQKLA